MFSVCCRNNMSHGTVYKLFQPKLRGFSALCSRVFKPSLVRSSITESAILKRNATKIHAKGERFRRTDNIPEGYYLIYKEKHVSLLFFAQAVGYSGLIVGVYQLLAFQFGFKWTDFGWGEFPMEKSEMTNQSSLLDNILKLFGKEEPEETKERDENDPENYKFMYNAVGFKGEEYLFFFIFLTSNLVVLKFSMRTPLRIYKKGNNCIAVLCGFVGTLRKRYLYFKSNECRAIIPIQFFVWRRFQVQIKDKYYVMVGSNFRSIADLNSTYIQIPVPTLMNRIIDKVSKLLGL